MLIDSRYFSALVEVIVTVNLRSRHGQEWAERGYCSLPRHKNITSKFRVKALFGYYCHGDAVKVMGYAGLDEPD
jgi:hypothetical protein